uniref:HAD family phosphatase n=1 Tax=Rhodosorus marinus TaxID=101924 RepID=A0A7S2ZF24_9RHOD|mmetsp:Transcript_17275/g.70140  ORF Transcript_17275/g.70140 Transcript_17275/m.70140 type:complete len:232 (+) Transcript_17275:39-734(+)
MGEVGRFPEWVEAIVFDLDGTLVETELLKARSYAKVAQELHECVPEDRLRLLQSDSDCQKTIRDVQSEREEILHPIVAPATISEGQKCADRAMKVFLTNLGATSEYIARKLVDELEIEPLLRPAMERFGEEEPWKALYKLRKEMYYDTFATEKNLYESRYPEALKIVEYARQSGIPLAVATSSSTGDAERVLEALRIRSDFKFVVGRDQVRRLIVQCFSIIGSQACGPDVI